MALVSCSECGREVSTTAPSCPGCGHTSPRPADGPVKVRRAGGKFEAAGFLLIVGGLLGSFADVSIGAAAMVAGFAVFLVGRFM